MNFNYIDSKIQNGLKKILENIIIGGSKEESGMPISLIKSDYQQNLEDMGWEFVSNIDAGYNLLMDYTENINLFRLLKKDCDNFYTCKKIKLARAHNRYGERFLSKKKIVAVYTKDRN